MTKRGWRPCSLCRNKGRGVSAPGWQILPQTARTGQGIRADSRGPGRTTHVTLARQGGREVGVDELNYTEIRKLVFTKRCHWESEEGNCRWIDACSILIWQSTSVQSMWRVSVNRKGYPIHNWAKDFSKYFVRQNIQIANKHLKATLCQYHIRRCQLKSQ